MHVVFIACEDCHWHLGRRRSPLFFDVTQETQQEQQDELLPAAIDSELSGENHESTSDLLTTFDRILTYGTLLDVLW